MKRLQILRGAGLMLSAGLMMGANFVWDGGGVNSLWSTVQNWDCLTEPCAYPDGTNDNAKIPFTSGGYTVDLITEQIGTLTIEGDVDFGGGNVTLDVATYTIDATESAVDVDVVMAAGPEIIANAP